MRRAVVVGFDYFARYLSQLVNEHANDWRLEFFSGTRIGMMRALVRLRGADALIAFGGPSPNAALALSARSKQIPVIVFWAGTDLLVAANNPFELEVAKQYVSADITGAPWLSEELRRLGISARYQPIIGVDAPADVEPLPERFTVLAYLPAPRRSFYGDERVYGIARAMPEVRFIVVGTGAQDRKAPANVEFRGFVKDMNRVIDASTVLLRLPEHDGPAMMVLEALARGRHAVWTHEFPGVFNVEETGQALSVLRSLQECHESGRLEPNYVGKGYVEQHCSRARIALSVESVLTEIVRSGSRRSPRPRYRVAISGYGLFCADVARNIERLHPEWEAQILRQGSRVETLSALFHLGRAQVWYTIGSPHGSRWMRYCAKVFGIPRVTHWVGSDIESARVDAVLRRAVQASRATHLAEVDWTVTELRELGFEAKTAPLPVRHENGGVKPLPARFSILVYVPPTRAEFYGLRAYERLFEELRNEEVVVHVVGGGSARAPAGIELVNHGWCSNLREIYEHTSVLVRCTPHDGLALMVIEALSFGRRVIWSRPFPHVTHVATHSELITAVQKLLEDHKRGALFADYAAAEMVRERYATDRCVNDIVSVFDSARAEKRIQEAG